MKRNGVDKNEQIDQLNPLSNRRIILGVTGGIAAYKACDLASALRKANADVHAILTTNAKEFVTLLTFQTITRNPAHCEQYGDSADWRPEHIDLAQRADHQKQQVPDELSMNRSDGCHEFDILVSYFGVRSCGSADGPAP